MRQINLLPDSLQKTQKMKVLHLALLSTVVPAVGVMLLIHFFLSFQFSLLQKKINQPPEQVEAVEISQMRIKIKHLHQQIREYYQKNRSVIDPAVKYYSAPTILNSVGEITLHKVWLTRFELDQKNRICQMEGLSFNTRWVSEFMLEFKKIPYLENVALISMEKGPKEKIVFKITSTLK